ncbi:hypothetical protein Q5425_02865 [Amycolatopsis sp. A133]|uniref:hypothetical protein n=1 Tax=Amycolatopsis sp. A133 TaxID=3064472 RepID=UPI0027F33654|nr:hypothetical protein [Amycolatopsis sp. A133]MDQ7802657.1 hypothetical protein [Amycolatopsis sp. A133]
MHASLTRSALRDRNHHRLHHVYLARTKDTTAQGALRHTANERASLIERRWAVQR